MDSETKKALQMYTQLREVKKENEILETMLIELKKKEVAGDGKTSRTNDSAIQLDELTKKLERTTRALEAEKLKVKGLFERVMVAEKEAQTAGPMLDELERKAEVSSRTAQQHKKELENLKQKLIKSDAEKNKIQNDLVKTQAQVQTLMKRQAS